MSKSKLIGILFDVSGSMKEPYKNMSKNDYSISPKSHSLTNILSNISKNLKIDIFTLLFGSNDGKILDFILLIKEIIYFLSSLEQDIYEPKKEFVNLMKQFNEKIDLDKYIYGPFAPTGEEVSFVCSLIHKNENLGKKIYDNLPEEVKYPNDLKDVGLGIYHITTHFFSSSPNRIDKEIISQIKNALEISLKDIIDNIFINIYKDDDFQKENYIKMDSTMLEDLLRQVDNLIEQKVPNKAKKNNIIDLIKTKIYGSTPLNEVSHKAFRIYSECKNIYEKKILIIITDGISTDGDPTDYVEQQSIYNDVYVVGIYISSHYSSKNKFYDENTFNISEKGAENLFKMSSKIEYKNPLFKFFLSMGWEMPSSGECKLFISLNNRKTMEEFIYLINQALDFKEHPFSGLMDVITTTGIHSFVNSYSYDYGAKNQIFGTCWANACAACIHFANKRILGRKNISFEDIRKHLLVNYSLDKEDGNHINTALKNIYNDYKLRMKEVDEKNARLAVMKGRPCIATFDLSAKQWANFSGFFEDHKTKYLDKATINKDDYPQKYYSTPGGHAVVLIEINHKGLTFLNSWGITWGDFGKFRIKNTDVLTNGGSSKMKFFDIYFKQSDLSSYEINYYKENYQKYVSKTLSYLIDSEEKIKELNNQYIKCQKCQNYSNVKNYKGNIFVVKCPLCSKIYEPIDENLKNCLYLREILPSEEDEYKYSLDNLELMENIKEIIKAFRIKKSNSEIIFNNFKASVNMLLILSDNRLCVCSSDKSIKIFEIDNFNYLKLKIDKIKAHSDKIWCIEEIKNKVLASGGYKDIKIWTINTNDLTLITSIDNAHNDYLNKIIKLDYNEFASCSRDGKIKVWNDNYSMKRCINAHNTYINNILKINNILVSGSNGEKCIKFWNINDYNLIQEFRDIYATAYNNCLIKVENNIFVGEINGIRIFTIEGNNISSNFYEDQDLDYCLSLLYLGNNIIIAGSTTGFIYIYKIIKKDSITLENVNVIRNNSMAIKGRNEYSVSCLAFDKTNSFIIAGSFDKSIKIYSYYLNSINPYND